MARARIPALLVLAGCLIAGAAGAAPAVDDPLEPFNRAMFSFNQAVVTWVIDPTVDTLGPRLPQPVVVGLGNAYSNLTEIEFVLNNMLVGSPGYAAVSAGRFAVNSTLGIGGLFDVATRLGLRRRELEFNESLCQTGLSPGPYLVLPLVGSANLYSAATLASAVAIEVYALSFISPTVAAADFIIIDLGGSASALRYMNSTPADGDGDVYRAARADHLNYVQRGCASGRSIADARRPPEPQPPVKFRRANSIATGRLVVSH